jgi:hypothetical protein
MLLIGSGTAAGDPGLPRRLLAWLRSRIRGSVRDGDPGEEHLADEAGTPVGMPHLVPLAVAEVGEALPPRAARSVLEERGRILPPT